MKDFFISYNKKDILWAKCLGEWLQEAGYSYVMQETDFQPGSNFILEMDKATKIARRTISVLSHDYLDALYTLPEWAAAFAKDPTGEKRLLIPVKVRNCKLTGLLAQIVFIDLVGLKVEEAQKVFLDAIKNLNHQGYVINNKKAPRSSERKKKPTSTQSSKSESKVIHLENSVNTGIIANILNIRPPRRSSVKIEPPSGTIATDRDKRNYIKYLIDRFNEFKKADTHVGDFKYVVIYSSIKRKYKCKWDFIPIEKFNDLALYLQKRIDGTILGKVRKKRGHRNYSSFEDFLNDLSL